MATGFGVMAVADRHVGISIALLVQISTIPDPFAMVVTTVTALETVPLVDLVDTLGTALLIIAIMEPGDLRWIDRGSMTAIFGVLPDGT